jgi:trimeric autotransporter adhesin
MLLSTFTVVNTLDTPANSYHVPPGSLRDAVNHVNADTQPGIDTINFAIGSGPQTIKLGAYALNGIRHSVVIDGTAQPGYAGKPLIELDGTTAFSNGGIGLFLSGGNSTVKGLVINRFHTGGIQLAGPGGGVIEGNYIGTDVTGTVALGNGSYGVRTVNTAHNTIGGTTAAMRNVISGNGRVGEPINDGVGVSVGGSGNIVEGNFIGTDVTGTQALGNLGGGMSVWGSGNIIGGTTATTRNLISGNGYGNGQVVYPPGSLSGVVIGGSGNILEGNCIGTDVTGTQALGNLGGGVYVGTFSSYYVSTGNTIGGTIPGAGNLIAYDVGDGVRLNSGTDNAIEQNSVFANGGLGIDLQGTANNSQAAPTLASAVSSNGGTAIAGTLTSAANTTYTLEFFSNPAGTGQGKTFLGSLTVTTDATGAATFTAAFGLAIAPDQVITATATDPLGNTSAFSSGVKVR